MLFNSYEFIFVYLPIVFFCYFIIAKSYPKWAINWLVIASLFFYGWWNIDALPLLLASICINYWFGSQLSSAKKSKAMLYIAVSANLICLGYFKYAGFFVSSLNAFNQLDSYISTIILPIGISFYTFTQISFLVDCWRGEVKKINFIHYMLFVSYFPHLVAGPVLHHKQMIPQFEKLEIYKIDYDKVFAGLVIFSIGLGKKVLLADPLDVYADQVFYAAARGDVISMLHSWVGVLAYASQIYFDFSGYSDMAIGVSLLFGIELPINFYSPYRAKNIIDFWRRWHISLSVFLRDYLYIPLGGNRHGIFKQYSNILITMLLGGLWHGANWTFMLWGGAHGLFIILNHVWRRIFPKSDNWGILYKLLSWATTFVAVCFAWVLFRSPNFSSVNLIYSAMLGFSNLHDTPASLAAIFNAPYISEFGSLNLNFGESFALVVSWVYSFFTDLIFYGKETDGLKLIILTFFVQLFPTNSMKIIKILEDKNDGTYKNLFWGGIAFYLLVIGIWGLNAHKTFIYFQF